LPEKKQQHKSFRSFRIVSKYLGNMSRKEELHDCFKKKKQNLLRYRTCN